MIPHLLSRASVVDRDLFLTVAARGRAVLHLGCADTPYFRPRAASGTLLHSRLAAVAKHIVGVDNNEEGVNFLKNELGFKNILLGDVESLAGLESGSTFDLIVAGELLEHLPNPGLCLKGLRPLLNGSGTLLVTVPNAFSVKGFARVARGVELVHPDHVSYYSIVTIKRLLAECGYSVVSHAYYVARPTSALKRLGDQLLLGPLRRVAPQLSDGIIVEAKPL